MEPKVTLNGEPLSIAIIDELTPPSDEAQDFRCEQKKHSLYIKPRKNCATINHSQKKGKIMIYDASQTFQYILNNTTEEHKVNFAGLTKKGQSKIAETFNLYRLIPKIVSIPASDLYKLPSINKTVNANTFRHRIKMMEQAGVIRVETNTEKDSHRKVSYVCVIEGDEDKAFKRMIENVEEMRGNQGERKERVPEQKDIVKVSITETPATICFKPITNDFEQFCSKYETFQTIFSNIPFIQFLKIYIEELEKRNDERIPNL